MADKKRKNPGKDPSSFGDPQKISSYFKAEWPCLIIVTITGIIYNVGLGSAVPYLEGQMAGTLADVFSRSQPVTAIVSTAALYLLAVLAVQFARFLKRLYVRKFANRMSRRMKKILYANIVRLPQGHASSEGTAMTKALSDAEDCVEGCRKFTTEIFDTGVVMVTYLTMLLMYDWRLTIFCVVFPPLAYVLAAKLKKAVTSSSASRKVSQAAMSDGALDRVRGALTYRVFGQEENQNHLYEGVLDDYEKKSVRANLLQSVPPSVYSVITMVGTVFILYFGARNVLQIGWKAWDIAAFTTFFSCYLKFATKSSHAANLITAVQKAEVSWQRIQPLLTVPAVSTAQPDNAPGTLTVQNVSIHLDNTSTLLKNITFSAGPGTITGITGEIASGKSVFGKSLLNEFSYTGSVLWNGQDLSALTREGRSPAGYSGHDPELFSDTLETNITLSQEPSGRTFDEVLHDVRLDVDLESFPEKEKTLLGEGGTRLSGGQQARVSLARALYSGRKLLILDDPFAALDEKTESEIFQSLKEHYTDRTILLISHRLRCFAGADQVLYLGKDGAHVSTHEMLYASNEAYRSLVDLQNADHGKDLDAVDEKEAK